VPRRAQDSRLAERSPGRRRRGAASTVLSARRSSCRRTTFVWKSRRGALCSRGAWHGGRMSAPRREIHLPANVTLSLRAGFVLAIANVLCIAIIAWAWMRVKGEANQISVTGSARQVIQSDLIVWEGKVFVNSPDLQKGYAALKVASDKT